MPTISVIVPIYNVEQYISECIESILNQSYKDFELILVDDGSCDNCGRICDLYAENDDRIIVIHKENGGLSSARNCGIDYVFEYSDSQYISFIDGDDYIDKFFLEELFKFICDSDISMCYMDKNFSNFSGVVSNRIFDRINYWNLESINPNEVVAWNKLYTRKLFNCCRYPLYKKNEDEYTIHYLIYLSNKISLVDKCLYFYRQNPNSIMGILSHNEDEFLRNNSLMRVERTLFYGIVSCRFLFDKNYYNLLDLTLTYYKTYGFIKKELFKRIKFLYKFRVKHKFKTLLGERLFLRFPNLYYFLKKAING